MTQKETPTPTTPIFLKTNVGEDMEKMGPFAHCWWECKMVQKLWKIVWRFLTKLKIELPHDSTILLSGVFLKELKSVSQRRISTPLFITAHNS